jgi:hypothetical protein
MQGHLCVAFVTIQSNFKLQYLFEIRLDKDIYSWHFSDGTIYSSLYEIIEN